MDDYAKKILRAKSRLIGKGHIDATEEFYVGCFLSGLKEDIRNTIELFEPKSLKIAIKYARKIEVVLGGIKKYFGTGKSQNYQQPSHEFQNQKLNRDNEGGRNWTDTSVNRNTSSSSKTMK